MSYIPSFQNQNWLLPPSLSDIIPEDHVCLLIEGFIDEQDFSSFDIKYSGAGHPAYHPRIIHKLKGNTSIQLRGCFPGLNYLGYKQHFDKGFDNLWARGYYCGSAGHVPQEQAKRYAQKCREFLAS